MISIGIRIIKTFGAFGGLIDILGVSRVPAAVAKVNHRGRFMLRAALNNGDIIMRTCRACFMCCNLSFSKAELRSKGCSRLLSCLALKAKPFLKPFLKGQGT